MPLGDPLTTTIHLPARARAGQALRQPVPPEGLSALPPGGPWVPTALATAPATPSSVSASSADLGASGPPSPLGFESSVSRDEALALERAAHAQAEGPARQRVSPVDKRALALVKTWAAKKAQAEAAGVDLRKKAFINKLISTGAALITLSAAVMLTMATGGAALPFLVIAAVRCTLLIGDTLCAWEDRRRALAVPPQPKLPMAANCLGNLLHGLGSSLGLSDERSKAVAKYGSGLVLVGLASAGIAFALPHEGISHVSAVLRYLSSAGGMAGIGAQAHDGDTYDKAAQARDEASAALHLDLLQAAQSPMLDKGAYLAWCAQLKTELTQLTPTTSAQTLADLDRLVAQAYESKDSAGPVDLVGADRATTAMRLVNDVVGLHAFGSFALTALAHGGIVSLA